MIRLHAFAHSRMHSRQNTQQQRYTPHNATEDIPVGLDTSTSNFQVPHRSKPYEMRRAGEEARTVCAARHTKSSSRSSSTTSTNNPQNSLSRHEQGTPSPPANLDKSDTPGVALVQLVEKSCGRKEQQSLSQAILAVLEGSRWVRWQGIFQQRRDDRVQPIQPVFRPFLCFFHVRNGVRLNDSARVTICDNNT